MAELIELSQKVKKEADLLLEKTGLVGLLKKYGAVCIRGSYELDLMVNGDIDVYVIDDRLSKERSVACLNELIRENSFRGYVFYDFVKRRKKGFPKGYYLGAKTRFKGNKWNVDIWFMRSMDGVSSRFIKKVSARLNDQNREVILRLKKIVKDEKIELPSFVIYDAVLEGGAADIKQLKDFATGKGFKLA